MKERRKSAMYTLGEVFNPIIPAFIVSGIAMGCANIISQYGNIDGNGFLCVFYNFLVLINNSFTSLLPCWIGFYTVKMAGGSPILGGMLGVATGLSEINSIASYLNLNGILYPGAGGVLASFFGALILSKIEKSFKKVLPGSISLVLTPLFSLFLALVPYVFLIMPIAGLLSALICNILEFVSLSESLFQNIIVGFFFAAVFLPINVAGLQHGIIALYPILLERYGYISLYPVFAMAGAGQVGAGIFVWVQAKKEGNMELSNLALSSSIPGVLGVAGPLIYGISLPHTRVLLASCLGAGVGGAIIKCQDIVSTGWGPSGILAAVMMNCEHGALYAMAIYVLCLLTSAVFGFLFCSLLLRKGELQK